MKGVILDTGSLHPGDLDWSRLQATVDEWQFFPQTLTSQLDERLAGADIVLSNKVVLDTDILSRHKHVKLIVVLATGTNNVDLDAAKRLGIRVCNNVGYATTSLVEHSLALMLALARNIPAYQQAVRGGEWQKSPQFCLLEPPIQQLSGAQLGIIGAGASGRGLATIARAMGMSTVALHSSRNYSPNEPELPRLSMAELLASSDVISVHCPLTTQTRGLIGEYELAAMKPTALLINTSRGGIVSESALHAALSKTQIAGAALDVLSEEPPVNGNRLIELHHPNLIITPHNAWGSQRARQSLIDQSAEIIAAFKRGKLINCVNLANEDQQ
ncbi:MAG: glycerate dehydrogenase [Bermanella sp.]|jgi:glycerate dehydrogenase